MTGPLYWWFRSTIGLFFLFSDWLLPFWFIFDMVGHRSLIPVWSLDIRGRRYSGRWADLKDMMRQAGEVTYTDAHQRMGKNRGEVCFVDREALHAAKKKFDGEECNGRKLEVRITEDGSRSRSRSKSRSKSRSRSRSRGRRSRSDSRDKDSRSKSRSKSRSRSRSRSR